MISLIEACEAVTKQISDIEIESIFELEDSWIIGYCEAETREELDEPPFRVYKKDGKIETFFPPDYDDEFLNNAIELEIPNY